MFKNFLAQMRSGTLSLKTVLTVYFVPISVVPTIAISVYAIRTFEEGTRDTLQRRASSERDAIIAEIDGVEKELLSLAREHARSPRLLFALLKKDKVLVSETIAGFRANLAIRLYSPDGTFIVGRKGSGGETHIPYISKEGLRKVRGKGETLERYFSEDWRGLVTVTRILLKARDRVIGILEEENFFGNQEVADLKNRRGVDVVLLTPEFKAITASFALSNDILQSFSSVAFQTKGLTTREPIFVTFGDARYAAFMYDLPSPFGKVRKWGFIALFVSMTSVDATTQKVKMALIYLTGLLILFASLFILLFSKRLVKPIEALVVAMKRVKAGRVEQIPNLDSTYEIEYLVRSFNEMARNVAAAKRTLELKLEELHGANTEIKNTQSTLVQSAKMISLGQLVAGVAHELNNPIAFIYSNMHHLSDYVAKVKELVEGYRESYAKLPEKQRAKMEKLEKDLEIDFILKDMEDLTRSCVEGANRTKEIVLGLRTFSRIEEADFRMADLHEGLRSTIRLLVTEFKDRVKIHEEFGEMPNVECNLSQMNQVFMNLLSNGAHAIEGKGDIWIRTRVDGSRAIIEIEDNGIGIPEDSLSKIFDPFFTTKRVGQGTGLGLSIAYGLVQKHQGTISVRSIVGKGTRFTISLPFRQSLAVAG